MPKVFGFSSSEYCVLFCSVGSLCSRFGAAGSDPIGLNLDRPAPGATLGLLNFSADSNVSLRSVRGLSNCLSSLSNFGLLVPRSPPNFGRSDPRSAPPNFGRSLPRSEPPNFGRSVPRSLGPNDGLSPPNLGFSLLSPPLLSPPNLGRSTPLLSAPNLGLSPHVLLASSSLAISIAFYIYTA